MCKWSTVVKKMSWRSLLIFLHPRPSTRLPGRVHEWASLSVGYLPALSHITGLRSVNAEWRMWRMVSYHPLSLSPVPARMQTCKNIVFMPLHYLLGWVKVDAAHEPWPGLNSTPTCIPQDFQNNDSANSHLSFILWSVSLPPNPWSVDLASGR